MPFCDLCNDIEYLCDERSMHVIEYVAKQKRGIGIAFPTPLSSSAALAA